ncbi:MAG: bis-aminopropyl spermidine synthase family protein [Patescibacteria group bacterium]|nr:bis-aminopropyl spermidine synthase family protein [Patescibacteria group bacterium]
MFTDPLYTPKGINLFVSRAIETLDRQNQTARIYVCYGNSYRAKERFLPIQKVLTDSGLMLRWVFDRFNRYEGAESVGSASSLYIAKITPKTKPLIRGRYDKPIYTTD